MSVRTRVEPLDRDVSLIISETLSPAAQSAQFAAGAKVFLDEADEINRSVLGRVPKSHTFVDGSENTPLTGVRPDGVIVREYELVIDVLIFIADELRAVSPVRTGRYKASHTLFADGREVEIGETIPEATEYVFLSGVEYARKIEGTPSRGPESPMAPRGVYEITALKAASRYGNVAKITFVWRSPISGARGKTMRDTRVPAILVTVGR